MTTSTKLPGTAANNNAVGTVAWAAASLNYIKSDVDGLNATTSPTLIGSSCRDKRVSIVKANGSIGATDKANTSSSWPTGSPASANYGSTSDLWDEAWSAEDINDADFGVVLSVNNNANPQSNYLVATNFGFEIPSGATINGIAVEINRYRSSTLNRFPYVDYIKISVTYTAGEAPAFILHSLSMTGCGK